MKQVVPALAIFLAAAAPAFAQKARPGPLPGQGIDWKGDWKAAIQESTARNVPIMVCVLSDGAQQTKPMTEGAYTDPKVIEASRNFVCVAAHKETGHGSKEVILGREKVKLCQIYHTVPCDTHVNGWSAAGTFFQGTINIPATVFAEPGGKEISKDNVQYAGSDLAKKMQEVLSKLPGEKVPLPVWQAGQQLARDAAAHAEKGDIRKAMDAWTKLGKLSRTFWFRDTSREGLDKLLEQGEKRIAEASVKDTPEEKRKAFQKVIDDFKGTRVADQAKKELDALK
jgi:hypothetical protein